MRRLLFLFALAVPLFPQATFFGQNHSNGTTGSLSGSVSTSITTANFTSQGTAGWRSWGSTNAGCPGSDVDSTHSGGGISTYTVLGGATVGAYGSAPVAISWTNGTIDTTQSSITDGCYNSSVPGGGFSFTAPAGTGVHTLTVYGWVFSGQSYSMNAHLSDSSASDYNNAGTAGATLPYVYTFVYNAASGGQTLLITWTTTNSAQVGLQGAALQ